MFRMMFLGIGAWVRLIHLLRFFKRYVPVDQKLMILDAGFGRGDYIAWFGYQYQQAQFVGYDLATEMHYSENFAHARNKINTDNISLKLQDLSTLDENKVYDVVYCIDVIEHISNNHIILENIYRALKPGGHFFLTVPYQYGGNILPKRVFERFEAWAEEEHIGEMRSLEETTALVQQIGFQVVEGSYIFTFPARLAWELDQAMQRWRGMRIRHFVLNTLATLELFLPHPRIGSIRLVLYKASTDETQSL